MLFTRIFEIVKHVIQKPSVFTNTYKVLREEGVLTVLQKIRKVYYAHTYFYQDPDIPSTLQNEIDSFVAQPLISIIMPVYNVDPQWLQRAVDSVLAQWYTNWELCIVDDASSREDTLNFLHVLENPKIKVIFSRINGNISAASNQAIAMAEGTYVITSYSIHYTKLYEQLVKIICSTRTISILSSGRKIILLMASQS